MKLLVKLSLSLIIGYSGWALSAPPVQLKIADQKGNMRAQLEAADALKDLPYEIQWSEFPAAAPLAEALNAGAVDAGIIGDAPLLFALAAGAQVKAIAVDKSDPFGTALIVNEGSSLKTAQDLKGKQIATGRGSIGHFVALKALAHAGLTEKDVSFRFLGPVDAKVALANGSVDVWATWEPYTALAEIAGDKVLINGRGLWSGNSFLAATDAALNDPQKRRALQDYLNRLSQAQVWANHNVDAYSATLAKIIGFPQQAAKLSFARRQLAWQAIDSATIEQQQATADFYHAHQLIAAPLNVQSTFASGFSIPALNAAYSAQPAQ